MPTLKGPDIWVASRSLAAGTSFTGPVIDIRSRIGTDFIGTVINGATGPTTPPKFIVEVSNDNFDQDINVFNEQLARTADNAKTSMPISLPLAYEYARVKFIAGAGQASTVKATGSSILTLG